jgi:hypothetical protein
MEKSKPAAWHHFGFLLRFFYFHRTPVTSVPTMYGPPQDCKGKALSEKTSLRQCIRPLGGDISPGHDEFRCVPVLISRSVVVDHYRDQVEGTPL